MKREFREYEKKNDFLICVDSDGSAMDTMEVKHRQCFGPCVVEEWGLQEYEQQVLHIWNAVNLYSINRGVNRFVGLLLVLEYVNKNLTLIEGLEDLARWVESTKELSNAAMLRYLEDDSSPFLQKVLHWAQKVSLHIALLPVEERRPFEGVAEVLLSVMDESDIVVVSAANPDAIFEEWELHGLAYFVNQMFSQNIGSKDFCISELLKKGYDPNKVIMIGDSMEDLEAARACGIHFYPIIIFKEEVSWSRFDQEALGRFYDGTYAGDYEQALIQEFVEALSASYE
ncbi:MAG: HAD hydrolase-like protein [Lachnospiraceae bacterium]|nr:HAD hydrolase-like protein [Lachnospiraceae bacterium]